MVGGSSPRTGMAQTERHEWRLGWVEKSCLGARIICASGLKVRLGLFVRVVCVAH